MHVAIVGAGPAGAWAAYLLAQRGARVSLIDPSHPREKPCGGGVTGRALALVGSALDIGRLPVYAHAADRVFEEGWPLEEATVEQFEAFDLVYRTLCAVMYNSSGSLVRLPVQVTLSSSLTNHE